EFRGPFSGPGSVAPIDWVGRVAAYAAQTIPPSKVLLGLAFYGYDWNTSTGRATSVGYPTAMAIAQAVQAVPTFDVGQQSVTFSYTSDAGAAPPGLAPQTHLGHAITTRSAPACDVAPPAAPPPSVTAPLPPPPAPGEPQTHEV